MTVLLNCLKRTKEQLIAINELSQQEGEQIFAHLTPVDEDASGNPLYTTTEADRAVEIALLKKRFGKAPVESMRDFFFQQTLAELAKVSTIIEHTAASSSDTMGTAEIAKRLKVTQAHVRRLIQTEKPSWVKMKEGKNYAIPQKLAEKWISAKLAGKVS